MTNETSSDILMDQRNRREGGGKEGDYTLPILPPIYEAEARTLAMNPDPPE